MKATFRLLFPILLLSLPVNGASSELATRMQAALKNEVAAAHQYGVYAR